ncbi:MAG: HK97-fold major capsid protein [Candidatus Micrarchaeia archaeon]
MPITRFEDIWKDSPFVKKAAAETVPPSPELAEQAWAKLLASPNWAKRVAFVMQTPLKNRLDYVAVGRKLLLVDELPQGEIPVYDLDIPEYGAVKISARGTAPIVETNVKRVEFPTFPISINESVKWEEITIRRYPIFDRAKERVAIGMAIAEDLEIFKLLKTASDVSPNTPVDVTRPLSRGAFAKLYATIAKMQLVPSAYIMNPAYYEDILSWDAKDLDQVSLNVIIETGQFGVLHGVRLILATKMEEGYVYCVTTPDKLGRLPERKSVEVKIWDNVPQQQFDIVGWEQIGLGIHNTAGVARLNVTG